MASLRSMSPIKPDYDELSSPDPLASSSNATTDASTTTGRGRQDGSRNTRRSTRGHTSRNGSIDLSPSKTITEQTLSPWRIRVTVEAEPEHGNSFEDGAIRNEVVTRTIKIPLRDASSPTQNATNRARKTQSSATKKTRRRSLTPERAGRGKRQSLTDLEAIVLGDDEDENEWTGRRSPSKRKTSRSRNRSKSDKQSQTPFTDNKLADIEIRADDGNDVDHAVAIDADNQSPELREIDPNRVSVKRRSTSIRNKPQPEAIENVKTKQMANAIRKASVNSAKSYPTPSPTGSEVGNSEHEDIEERELDRVHDVEEPYDTFIESEEFTMIDLDSLPSIKQIRSSPNDQVPQALQPTPQEDKDANVTYPDLSEHESTLDSNYPSSPPEVDQNRTRQKPYSIGHLEIPSSTHVYKQRHITPHLQSPPTLPSPPKPSSAKGRSSPDSGKARRAGIALQDAVSPSIRADQDSKQAENISRRNDVFNGFDANTQRELRAGLRFGEELAKKVVHNDQAEASKQQVWRGETVIQHTPVPTATRGIIKPSHETNTGNTGDEYTEDLALIKEQEWQHIREQVISQAKSKDDHSTVGNNRGDEEEDQIDEGNETYGDIWLAEAKNTSSPREDDRVSSLPQWTDSDRKQRERAKEIVEKPKRTSIPSPWKRGENISSNNDDQTSSILGGDASFTGLLWKDGANTSSYKFGAEVISNPDAAQRQRFRFDRKRSEEYDSDLTLRQQSQRRRQSDRQDKAYKEDQIVSVSEEVQWRNAEEVVEEETAQLEESADIDGPASDNERDEEDLLTKLHETSLEDVPEQDLSSSPKRNHTEYSHESYSTEDTDVPRYQQRVSLSPSKERPNTPRSALKGGRLSFAVGYGAGSDELNMRKVIWAKRSSCVNEEWEESMRSIRSATESVYDITTEPTEPEHKQKDVIQSQQEEDELQDNDILDQRTEGAESKKGWFNWFRKNDSEASRSSLASTSLVPNLDGTIDVQSHEIKRSNQDNTLLSSPPPSRPKARIPSYLVAPSYPSDPSRDASIPMSTSGNFENSHFRTLHIIYKKSVKAQNSQNSKKFHGPSWPHDIREDIRQLVENRWEMNVDESKQIGEEFTFHLGREEARVLERFCREVEHGYGGNRVEWGWSMEQIAIWLGRIAVGEVVREKERSM